MTMKRKAIITPQQWESIEVVLQSWYLHYLKECEAKLDHFTRDWQHYCRWRKELINQSDMDTIQSEFYIS